MAQSHLVSYARRATLPYLVVLSLAILACGGDSASPGSALPTQPQAPIPTRLFVAPRVAVMDIGVSEQLVDTVLDAQSKPLTSYSATWSSSDQSLASVSSNGIVTALAQGQSTIYVAAGNFTDSIAIVITPPPPPESRFALVAVKDRHACALSVGGATYCWGDNSGGWVDPASSQAVYTRPILVNGVPSFTSLVLGNSFTCGLTSIGDLYCWGTIPTDTSGTKAPRAIATGLNFTQAAAGFAHICGLTQIGDVYCWGTNTSGQLGIGNSTGTNTPTKVAGNFKFTSVTADTDGTCGIATDSTAVCWGNASLNGTPQLTPTRKDATKFTSLRSAPDGSAVCGTTGSNTASCWDAAFVFPFGISQPANGVVGFLGNGPPFTTLQPGVAFICGLAGGFAYCWGTEDDGQNGLGLVLNQLHSVTAPNQVLDGIQFQHIDVGVWSTCGITVTGRLWCWGGNQYGELGSGDTIDAATPAGNNIAGN